MAFLNILLMVPFINMYLYKLPCTQVCLFKFGGKVVPQKADLNLWVAECRSHYLSKKHSISHLQVLSHVYKV